MQALPAFAHPGHDSNPLQDGLLHPLTGLDHLLMLLGTGVLAALTGRSLIGVVNGCRRVRKPDMVHNTLQPLIEVDAQTYQVRADGELLVCEPASELPLAQRYFLF